MASVEPAVADRDDEGNRHSVVVRFVCLRPTWFGCGQATGRCNTVASLAPASFFLAMPDSPPIRDRTAWVLVTPTSSDSSARQLLAAPI